MATTPSTSPDTLVSLISVGALMGSLFAAYNAYWGNPKEIDARDFVQKQRNKTPSFMTVSAINN